jgi:hypothetical protein
VVIALRVSQLEERRAAAIARGDLKGTDEAEHALDRARQELRQHEESSPTDAPDGADVLDEMKREMPTVFTGAERAPLTPDRRVGVAKRAVAELRDYFDVHPAPTKADGVSKDLGAKLHDAWEEYRVMSRRMTNTPVVVPGRSESRTRVQWVKYDQLIINTFTRRVTLINVELEVAEAAGDTQRAAAMTALLAVVTEALTVSAQAARVEVPAV